LKWPIALVKGTEAAPAIDPAAEKMAIGVRATVSTKIRAWAYLPDAGVDQELFSVWRFVENEKSDEMIFAPPRGCNLCIVAGKSTFQM